MSARRRVALVTGASRGIGMAILKSLAAQGFTAIGASRTSTDMDLMLDVRDESAVERVIAGVIARHGSLDVLVNNAGIVSSTTITECSLREWRDVIDTNLTGPFLCSKHALRHYLAANGGVIINVASIAGRAVSPTASEAYTASKAGLIGMTKQLAWRYADRGVRVNCVAPSQTVTSMLESSLTRDEIAELGGRHPMKHLAAPSEIAEVVTFLASDRASYVNGAVIDVHGGQALLS